MTEHTRECQDCGKIGRPRNIIEFKGRYRCYNCIKRASLSMCNYSPASFAAFTGKQTSQVDGSNRVSAFGLGDKESSFAGQESPLFPRLTPILDYKKFLKEIKEAVK